MGDGEGEGVGKGEVLISRIVLRAEAASEFDEAFDWYEARGPGLGSKFAEAIQVVFDRILVSPTAYAVTFGDVRKAVVRRFPYCVFYRTHIDRVEILAVFHSSRDPAIWQSRA